MEGGGRTYQVALIREGGGRFEFFRIFASQDLGDLSDFGRFIACQSD
jgi:hypothetical protein